MVELEVRCCCQPQKLLGYLQVEKRLVHRGGVVHLQRRVLQMGAAVSPRTLDVSVPVLTDIERLTLPIEEFFKPDAIPPRWLAIKAEGVTLETLRRFRPQFREAIEWPGVPTPGVKA